MLLVCQLFLTHVMMLVHDNFYMENAQQNTFCAKTMDSLPRRFTHPVACQVGHSGGDTLGQLEELALLQGADAAFGAVPAREQEAPQGARGVLHHQLEELCNAERHTLRNTHHMLGAGRRSSPSTDRQPLI